MAGFDLVKHNVLYFCVVDLDKLNIVCFGGFVHNLCSLKVLVLSPKAESKSVLSLMMLSLVGIPSEDYANLYHLPTHLYRSAGECFLTSAE